MDGLYKVLGIPFGFVLELIYSSVGFGSYAVSIILLTLFARALTVPSSIKQQQGMAKTQRIQSKIRKIQAKYAGDQRKIQEETTALYQREGYNPMGAGCSPMIIQFVILFGLIGAIYYPLSNFLRIDADEIKALTAEVQRIHNQHMGGKETAIGLQIELYVLKYIDEIIALYREKKLTGVSMDTLNAIKSIDFTIFGVSLGDLPSENKVPGIIVMILSALTSALSSVYSFIKQKQQNSTAGSGPMMGCMLIFMPLMSLWFVWKFPIGIGVYWIASGLFGFISTVIIGHFYSPKKTLARLMVDETVERRSKEENQKLIAAKKDK